MQRAVRPPQRYLASDNRRGFVLILSYMVISVLLVLQATYLTRFITDNNAVARHAARVKALHIAEAGLDDAMVQLRVLPSYTGKPLQTWASGAHQVTITTDPNDPAGWRRYVVDGYYPDPLDPAVNPASAVMRRLEGIITLSADTFDYAIFGNVKVEMNAGTSPPAAADIFIDSYDSADGPYGAGPITDDAGHIGTNGDGSYQPPVIQMNTGTFNIGTSRVECGQGCDPLSTATGIRLPTNPVPVYGLKQARSTDKAMPNFTEPVPPANYLPITDLIVDGGPPVTLDRNHPRVFALPGGRYAAIFRDVTLDNGAQVLTPTDTIELYVQRDFKVEDGSILGDVIVDPITPANSLGRDSTKLTIYNGEAGGNMYLRRNIIICGAIYAPNEYTDVGYNFILYGSFVVHRARTWGRMTVHYDQALGAVPAGPTLNVDVKVWK